MVRHVLQQIVRHILQQMVCHVLQQMVRHVLQQMVRQRRHDFAMDQMQRQLDDKKQLQAHLMVLNIFKLESLAEKNRFDMEIKMMTLEMNLAKTKSSLVCMLLQEACVITVVKHVLFYTNNYFRSDGRRKLIQLWILTHN